MKKLISIFAFLLLATTTWAQISEVTGTVVEADDGSPVIGAVVTITGTEIRVSTDLDGHFVIKNIPTGAKTLTATSVGLKPAVVDIAPTVKITMQLDAQVFDDVVVVAFGKQKREAFTGSAGVMKSDEISKIQVNDPITALDGKVSGVQIMGDNDPSGSPTIIVRGIGTINANNDPLIVVDGMPFNGYFRDINPADIDNISVLKDAASNALYGARGANGVILITTKNATKGVTKVTVDMKWGVNSDAKVDYDVISNPAEYYEAHYMALRNYYVRHDGYTLQNAHVKANQMLGASSNLGGLGYIVYSVPVDQYLIGINGRLNPSATLGNRVSYDGSTYLLTPDNWREHGLRDGFRQEYNLSIASGNNNSTFYGSLGYLDTEGITYGSELQRVTAKLKADCQAYPWLKVGGNAGLTHTVSDAQADAFSVCHNIAPIYPLFIRNGFGNILQDEHGNRYDYGDGANAGLIRNVEKSNNSIQNDRLNKNRLTSNAFSLQGYAEISFLEDFRLTVNGSAYVLESRLNYGMNPYYGYLADTGGYVWTQHFRQYDTNFQQLLNWSHKYGEHSLDALVGHEYNRSKFTDLQADKNNVANFDENIELDGSIVNGTITGNTTDYNVEGWFARVMYDYSSRYFASASFRYDGSSRFHPDHRWGKFWSLGAAWIISKEEWFPKTPAINTLKLKLSYGSQGNDNIEDYLYADYYNIVNSNDETAFAFSRKGNPNITWETVGNLNAGVEFDLFNNMVNGSIDYYHRKTTDMLTTTQIPASMGYSYYWDNVGDMVNQGVEINLSVTPIRTKSFTWNLNGNLSYNHNRVTRLSDDNRQIDLNGHMGYQSTYYFYGEGLPLYTWYMPEFAGVNSEGKSMWYAKEGNADLDAAGNAMRGPNGDCVTTNYSLSEYRDCGTALPDIFGGFGTTLHYAGFDLSAQFNYSVGGKKLDAGYQSLMASPTEGLTGYNLHRDVLSAWSETNTGSDIPRWQYADTYSNATSSRFLTDASYLAFKSINLGYTLPKKVIKPLKTQSIRVYFSVDNVAYWTRRKGFDPRTVLTTGDDTQYSPMRTFMGGINIVF